MRLTRSNASRIFLIALLICAVFVYTFAPHANAQSTSTAAAPPNNPQRELDCGAEPWGCFFGVIIFMISGAGAFFVMIGAFLLKLALIMSPGIIEAPVVRQGFAITLSFANLGFIFAIVVMAVGTMLRMQSYGMKQMLWKLVVAAVLVNFSLVIAGAILNIADRMALYFVGQGVNTDASNYGKFVENLTTAFKPQAFQRSMNWGKAINAEIGTPFGDITVPGLGLLRTTFNLFATPFTQFSETLRYFLHVIFAFTFTGLIALSFFAATIMLFIRYVALGILLVLMPFAWLLWLFPSLSSHFSSWWNAFIRWTFFAPILTFFLYLAIFAALNPTSKENIKASVDKAAGRVPSSGVRPGASSTAGSAQEQEQGVSYAVAEFLTGDTGIIRVGAEQILIIALAWGGLFSANYLSIKGAQASMNTIQGWGKGTAAGASRYGARRFKQAASYPLRRPFGEDELSAGERMRRGLGQLAGGIDNLKKRKGLLAKAAGYALTGTGVGWLAKKGLGGIAKSVTAVEMAGGKKLVQQFKEKHRNKKSREELGAAAVSAKGPELAALIELMREKFGYIDMDLALRESTEKLYMRLGMRKEYGQIEDATVSRKMWEAYHRGAPQETRDKFAREHVAHLDPSEIRHLVASGFLSGDGRRFGTSDAKLSGLARDLVAGGLVSRSDTWATAAAGANQKSYDNLEAYLKEGIARIPDGEEVEVQVPVQITVDVPEQPAQQRVVLIDPTTGRERVVQEAREAVAATTRTDTITETRTVRAGVQKRLELHEKLKNTMAKHGSGELPLFAAAASGVPGGPGAPTATSPPAAGH